MDQKKDVSENSLINKEDSLKIQGETETTKDQEQKQTQMTEISQSDPTDSTKIEIKNVDTNPKKSMEQESDDYLPEQFKYLGKIEKNSIENYIYGCMFGQIIGDSLGGQIEFTKVTEKKVEDALKMNGGNGGGVMGLKPGQITDDSEMALSILRGLNQAQESKEESKDEKIVEKIAKQFYKWYWSNPLDIGITTRKALNIQNSDKNNSEQMIEQAKFKNYQSLSNGSLMRCSSMAIYCALKGEGFDFKKLKTLVQMESSLTHSNPIAQAATTLWVYTIQQLILNHNLDLKERVKKVLDSVKEQYQIHYEKNTPNVLKDLWKAFQNKTLPDPKQSKGYLAIAWVRGLVLLQDLLDKPIISFYELMKEVLNWGGDTDTNACIIGALFGAILGFDHFKNDTHCKDWVKKTLECKQRDNFRSNQVILETKILIDTMKSNNKDQQKKDEFIQTSNQ